MSDFNDDLYAERKAFWIEKLNELAKERTNSEEDDDAFWNALEDYSD